MTTTPLDALRKLIEVNDEHAAEFSVWQVKWRNALDNARAMVAAADEALGNPKSSKWVRDYCAAADEAGEWVCATCGHAGAAHQQFDHPSFACAFKPVLRPTAPPQPEPVRVPEEPPAEWLLLVSNIVSQYAARRLYEKLREVLSRT